MTGSGKIVTHSLALIGEGIGKSLTPAMHEKEGRELGMSVTYRIVDTLALGLGPDDLPDLLTWARRFGLTGLNVTHPFKKAVIPLLDELSDRATALGAVNTVVLRDGRTVGHNTDWCGYSRPLDRMYPGAAKGRTVLIGAGGRGGRRLRAARPRHQPPDDRRREGGLPGRPGGAHGRAVRGGPRRRRARPGGGARNR